MYEYLLFKKLKFIALMVFYLCILTTYLLISHIRKIFVVVLNEFLALFTFSRINFDYNSPSTTTQDDTRKILCLHGWLDNAASFNRLAPLLLDSTETPTEIVCLDFPGHGLSGMCYFSLVTRVYYMSITSTWCMVHITCSI